MHKYDDLKRKRATHSMSFTVMCVANKVYFVIASLFIVSDGRPSEHYSSLSASFSSSDHPTGKILIIVDNGNVDSMSTGNAQLSVSRINDVVHVSSNFGSKTFSTNRGSFAITNNEDGELITRPITQQDRKQLQAHSQSFQQSFQQSFRQGFPSQGFPSLTFDFPTMPTIPPMPPIPPMLPMTPMPDLF